MLLGAGMGGHYVLDEYGDRDVNFSIIYTSAVTGKVRWLSNQQLARSMGPFTFVIKMRPGWSSQLRTALWVHQFALGISMCLHMGHHEQAQWEHLFWHVLSVSFQYETLVVFDTSRNKTRVIDTNPALPWKGGTLPSDQPENSDGRLIHTYTLMKLR